MGLSTEFWRTEFWRNIELPDVTWNSAIEFKDRFIRAVFAAMDPNSLLVQGWNGSAEMSPATPMGISRPRSAG